MFSSLFSRLPLSLSSGPGNKNGNHEGDEPGSGRSSNLPWQGTEANGSSSNAANRPKKEGSIVWSHQGQGTNGVTISNPIPRMTTNTLADFDDYSSHHSPRTPNMKGPNSASLASAGSAKSGRAPFSSGLIQSSLEDKGQRGRPQRMGSYSQTPMLHTPVMQNHTTQYTSPLQTPQQQQTPIQYGQAVTSSAPSTPFYSYAPPEVVRVESGTDSEDTTRKVAGSPEMLPHQVPADILRPSSTLGDYVPLTRKTQPQPISDHPSPETGHALYSYPYGHYGDVTNMAHDSNPDLYNSPVDDDDDKEIPEVFHLPPKSVSSSSSSSGQTATATKATFRQGLKLYVPPYAQSTHSSQSENSILHSIYAFPPPPSHIPFFATGQSLGQNQTFPVDVTTAQQIQIQAPISAEEAEAYYQGINTDVYGGSYNYPQVKLLSPIQEQDYVSPASASASVSMASSRFKFKMPGFMTGNGSQESVLPSAAAGRYIGGPGVVDGDDKGSTRTQRTGSIGSVANSFKGHQQGMNLSRAGSLSVLKEGLEAAAEGGSQGSAGDREPTGPILGRGLFITRQLKRTVSQTSSRSDGQNQPTTPHTPGNRLSGPTSVRDISSPHTPTPTFHSNPNASVSMILSPTSTIATTGTTNVSMHTPASTFINSPRTTSPAPGQTPVSAVNAAVAAAAGLIVVDRPNGTTPAGAGTTVLRRPAPAITITPMPQYQAQGAGGTGSQSGGGGLLKLPSLPSITPIDLRFSSFLGRDRGNQAAGVAHERGPALERGYVDGVEGEDYDDDGDYVVDDDGDYDYDETHGDYDRESLHAESYMTASIKDVDGQRRKSNNGKGRQVDADEEDDFELDELDKDQHRLSSESAEPPPAPLSPMPPKSLHSFKSGEHRLKTGESFIHRRWDRDVPMGVTASPTLFRTRSPSRWFFKKANGIASHTPAFWSFWFGFLFPVLWLVAGWHFTNAGEMPPKVTMWEWYFLRGSRWWLQGITGRLRTMFGCCLPRRPASQRSSGTAETPQLHHQVGSVTLRQGMARKKMSAAQSQARIGKVYPALPRWVAEKQSTDDGRMRLNDPKRSLRGISFGYPFIPRPLGSHGSYTGMDPSELGSHSILGRMLQRLLRIATSPNRVLDQLYGVKLREVRGRPESGRRMFDPWIQRSRYAFCYALLTLAIAMCAGSAYLIVVNTRRL